MSLFLTGYVCSLGQGVCDCDTSFWKSLTDSSSGRRFLIWLETMKHLALREKRKTTSVVEVRPGQVARKESVYEAILLEEVKESCVGELEDCK